MATARKPLLAAVLLVWLIGCADASAALRVQWTRGMAVPGTPARYDRIGVLKIGPAHARNVLVLVPGTSAGSASFAPLAQWIVSRAKGWQVWSIERRENLLEDQSVLDRAKSGHATAAQLFNYYLGFITNPVISPHFRFIPDASVSYAKRWGMAMLVSDLHGVIGAALGGSGILDEARQLAVQSHIPLGQVTLINRHRTYAHNDPNSAYPHNVFFAHLIPFLARVASGRG